MASSYDPAKAQRVLADYRQKRRSAAPEAVAEACTAL